MKRLIVILAALLLVACANTSTNAGLKAAYDFVDAYVVATTSALQRGRITPEQAARASANAKKAVASIDAAAVAMVKCVSPCDPTQILQGIQPTLLELERELRARESKQ